MAMSKSANIYSRQAWEESDFPILCNTCLGDNPYVRMTKEKFGKECKTCARPFTVFRWCPGARMRFKKTEVCQTCAKMKNVCQTCLLDLEYGLPVQVRDAALKLQDEMPKSDVGKEFHMQNIEREIANSDGSNAVGALGKAPTNDMLLKLARTAPYYKRNRPHICSFWVKGECKRGEECPYRHEKPTDPDDPLADQNIKDRFYGINDPVAEKLMRRYSEMPKLDLPDDKSITTIYVGNLGDQITESDLRDHFYQHGELRSVTVASKQQCAFVQFVSRGSAELAAEKSFNKLILKGRRLNVKWGKSHGTTGTSVVREELDKRNLEPVPGLPHVVPPPPEDFFNLSAMPAPYSMPLLPLPMFPRPVVAPPLLGPHGPLRRPLPPPPPGMHFHPGMRMLPPGRMRPPPPPLPPHHLPPAGIPSIHYPSQDPALMGAAHNKTAA